MLSGGKDAVGDAVYDRHQPGQTRLYQLIEAHYPALAQQLGQQGKRLPSREVASPAERHAAMTWTQRLKRVFPIDIEICGRCGGSLSVIACIEDQKIIDRILAHFRDREQDIPPCRC